MCCNEEGDYMYTTQEKQKEPEVYEFVKRSKKIMQRIMKEKGFTAKQAKEAMGLRADHHDK